MNEQELYLLLKSYFDYAEGHLIWKIKKGRATVGSIAGSNSKKGYIHMTLKGKTYQAHRLIFLWHLGYLPPMLDHINGNGRDNRIENLREATPNQNQHNRCINKNNTSGHKGVVWNKTQNKWQAKCKNNGVYKHLGYFSSIDDASEVVAKYRVATHGKFAKHY